MSAAAAAGFEEKVTSNARKANRRQAKAEKRTRNVASKNRQKNKTLRKTNNLYNNPASEQEKKGKKPHHMVSRNIVGFLREHFWWY